MKSNEERDIALKATRKRNVDLTLRVFVEKLLLGGRHDADDLNRFFSGVAAEIAAHPDVLGIILGFRRVIAGVLDALAQGVAFWPKFLRQNFIDDRDHRPAWLSGLSLSEQAAAPHGQTNGREVIGADAVPGGVERKAFGGGSG